MTQFQRHRTERPQLGARRKGTAAGITLLDVPRFLFRKRLKAKNLMYIRQILYVLEKLVTVLGGKECHAHPNWRAQLAGLGSLGTVRTHGFCVS